IVRPIRLHLRKTILRPRSFTFLPVDTARQENSSVLGKNINTCVKQNREPGRFSRLATEDAILTCLKSRPDSPILPALAIAFAILFILMGLLILPYTGIQTDEAIFSEALYPPGSPLFAVSVFHKKLPIMVMTSLR